MRYFYAAYRKGGLSDMGLAQNLDAREFSIAFQHDVSSQCDGAWTLFAETKEGFIPVGGVFGFWPHMQAEWMMVHGIVWFPWASVRNQVESLVGFFNAIRTQIPMLGFTRQDHKRIYEICAAHGVMRRVGTSQNVFRGEPAALFETRARQ